MRLPIARILRAVLPVLALNALLVGCAGALPFLGGGGKVTVTVAAADNSNNCGGGSASALKIRVFQAADEAAIRTVLNNKAVSFSKRIEAAGATVLGKVTEDFVSPGTSKEFVLAKDPKAVVIVVEGNYCKKTGADWYYIQPAKKKSLKLTSEATGFTLTTGK